MCIVRTSIYKKSEVDKFINKNSMFIDIPATYHRAPATIPLLILQIIKKHY